MNRSRVRAGSALAALLFLFSLVSTALPARAQTQPVPSFWFSGTRLIFEHADRVDDEIAVRASDPGLLRFLARVGATISWQPSSRYVVVTTVDRRTLTFTLGAPTFQTGSATQNAPLNAYLDGNEAYIPFLTLARSLYIQPVQQGNEYVLQPQLGALDVRADGRKTVVTLHGGALLHFKKVAETPERVTLAFTGTGSALQQTRRIDSQGLSEIDVLVSGTPRNPASTVTFDGPPGSTHAMYGSTNPNELVLVFGPRDVALGGVPIPSEADARAQPAAPVPAAIAARSTTTPNPADTPSTGPTPSAPAVAPADANYVTAVESESPSSDSFLVHIAVSAAVPFEWHRLGDDRFYVDIRNATLTSAAREDHPNVGFVTSIRVRQLATAPTPIVRVALTLTPNRRIDVVPDERGVSVNVADSDAGGDVVARVGTGQTGGAPALAGPVPSSVPSDWKFGPSGPAAPPPGSNPRLIVIDAGHGGSDTGAMKNGLVEKDIALDVSLRLRTLLTARGWIVKMTRDHDVDVWGPNAADIAELQARVDVANNAGARMFVSVHVNSSTSANPSGTTSYYYKPEDRALALAIQHRLIPALGTKDDGVQKERFYVIRHTSMPAVLVETAFMSNTDDASRLRSSDFRQSIAQGIADGIKDYAGAPSGSVSQQ